jgi:hypothetical protein
MATVACAGRSSCPAADRDQSVEGFDLRIKDFDLFLMLARAFAFRYCPAGLYRLIKLVAVKATNLILIFSARLALT